MSRFQFEKYLKPYEILEGAIDMHYHAAPDVFERPLDEIDVAKRVREIGYRAFLFKGHATMTVDRAYLVNKIIGADENFQVYGGIVLNQFVGGINPDAVDAAIRLGAKMVWMPTIHAENHLKTHGAGYSFSSVKVKAVKGIAVLDEGGNLIPEVIEILEMIAHADIAIGTAHLSYEERQAFVKAAFDAGVKKVIVTHAEADFVNCSIEEQKQLADMGAIIEHSGGTAFQDFGNMAPERAKAIKAVGAERCIIATDLGQEMNPVPWEGMRLYVRALLKQGISMNEIDVMLKENTAKLLGLK
ncbi:MAG: histidinol phosphatase [Candidatus Bathyarchaeota archaeon]|nr:MAG: histidinol phosphatase [Candidatus Bathyarchaeota archaeon]